MKAILHSRSPCIWFFCSKEPLCRGRMHLWTSIWSTSVQEGYQHIYLKLYLSIFVGQICLLYLSIFLFIVFFCLKWSIGCMFHGTLHCISTKLCTILSSVGNKQTVAQRKNLIESRWKLKSSGPLMITQHSTLDKPCCNVQAGSLTLLQGHEGKCAAVALNWLCVLFGSICFGYYCCAASQHQSKSCGDRIH